MYDCNTHQFLLFHALHEDDEQMLGLCATVGESLLYGYQQLVSQRLIDNAAEAERQGKKEKVSGRGSCRGKKREMVRRKLAN